MEVVLSIAGSDPSGGAGIQQDLKVITALGCHGATVITALTSQNTLGVHASMPVPREVVASQLQAVLSDLHPAAIKIGMIPNQAVAEAIVEALRDVTVPVVYDPVMISTSGFALMQPEALGYIVGQLVPRCTLVTPNLPEAEYLKDCTEVAKLVKGGHADDTMMTDRLIMPDGTTYDYTTEKIETPNLHGTGCTLSSAIAAHLALGATLPEAVGSAKTFITEAIRRSASIRIGHGNGPLQMP